MNRRSFHKDELSPGTWQRGIVNNDIRRFSIGDIVYLNSNLEDANCLQVIGLTRFSVTVCSIHGMTMTFPPHCLTHHMDRHLVRHYRTGIIVSLN